MRSGHKVRWLSRDVSIKNIKNNRHMPLLRIDFVVDRPELINIEVRLTHHSIECDLHLYLYKWYAPYYDKNIIGTDSHTLSKLLKIDRIKDVTGKDIIRGCRGDGMLVTKSRGYDSSRYGLSLYRIPTTKGQYSIRLSLGEPKGRVTSQSSGRIKASSNSFISYGKQKRFK